jgi:hypothetical protein
MTGQTVGAGGVNLAGTFNSFSATATPMTSIGNGVYEASVTLNIGSDHTYKFVNGSNYEIVPAACGANDGGGNINRTLTVPATATTLNTVCFNACDNSCGATATTAAIKFRVNMTTQTVAAGGVYLAGTFNGFSATANPMTNIGNNIYEATVTLNIGSSHTYKFVNGSNYENVPAACGANDGSGNINRTLTVPATATTLNTVCFNECANCPATSQVTFAVDMSLYPPTTEGIFVAGSFNGFSTTATPMTNTGNNVYKVTLNLPQNTQQLFKYVKGTEFELINSECGILGSQTVYDRFVDVTTQNATLSTVCWGSCNACGVVSVDGNKAEILSVYPNPSENTIRLSKAIDGRFEMIDLNGRVVMQSASQAGFEEINISALPSGIYLLRVTDKGKMFHVKVAKN